MAVLSEHVGLSLFSPLIIVTQMEGSCKQSHQIFAFRLISLSN